MKQSEHVIRLSAQWDPDQWIASGKKLLDFRMPSLAQLKPGGMAERIFRDNSELAAHLGRWTTRLGILVGPKETIEDVIAEEILRALWNETR